VLHADAGQRLELLAAQMARAAHAPRAVADLARVRLGVGNEVGHRLVLGVGAHRHEEGRAEQRSHRVEMLQRHEVARLVQVRQRGDVLAVELQQRVAVGRRAARLLDGDEAAAAGLVVDHHALVPQARELVGDQAQHRVGAAAGRERGDQRHGLAGVVAGVCRYLCQRPGGGAQAEKAREQCAREVHVFVSWA
jgi:hypothetical protein